MRLYSLTGDTAISDGEHGRFEAGEDGGFDLPEDLGQRLNRFPTWENDIERQERLLAEELERRRDPLALLEAVERITRAGESIPVASQAPAAVPEPTTEAAKAAPRRTPAKTAK